VTYSYTYNSRPIESRIWSIEQRYFQWPWTTPISSFKVTPFFDAEYLRNGTTYRHSVIEILIGTYTRSTQQCHFEWSWVTLSDLAKYSMTVSVARSLCDSSASCSYVLWRFNQTKIFNTWQSVLYDNISTPWCASFACTFMIERLCLSRSAMSDHDTGIGGVSVFLSVTRW